MKPTVTAKIAPNSGIWCSSDSAVPCVVSATSSEAMNRTEVSPATSQMSRQGPGLAQGRTRNRKNIATSRASTIPRTTRGSVSTRE